MSHSLVRRYWRIPTVAACLAALANPATSETRDALLGLWTPEALAGQPNDKQIRSLHPPDHRAPDFGAESETLPPLPPERTRSIRQVRLPQSRKLVALTFDLCEQGDEVTGYDRDIVNVLREQNVPATFYAGGKWLRSHEEKALQLMADPRFELGNHAWTHGNLRVLSGDAMLNQIRWTQLEYRQLRRTLIERAQARGLADAARRVPEHLATFRFPFGTCNAESLRAVNAAGLAAVQWDVVSGDPQANLAPATLAQRVVAETRPGSIMVFHGNGRGVATAAALPRIVGELRAKGFEFATVSQLLAEGAPVAVDECYERRPGDNRRYDKLFGDGTGRH